MNEREIRGAVALAGLIVVIVSTILGLVAFLAFLLFKFIYMRILICFLIAALVAIMIWPDDKSPHC